MTKITPLIAPIIKPVLPNDSRIVNTLHTYNSVFGELVTDTRVHNHGYNSLICEIKNNIGKKLGDEIFSIDKEHQTMFGYYIEVQPEYRSSKMKGNRFGELMRLSSIITMLENNIKHLDITSKDTAIYYHSKYKFVPSNKYFNSRDRILESLVKNCQNPLDEILKEATKILERIKDNPPAEEQRALNVETNKLAKAYIDRIMSQNSQKENILDCAMDMRLTSQSVIENKNFFNELFEKHGIDYKI